MQSVCRIQVLGSRVYIPLHYHVDNSSEDPVGAVDIEARIVSSAIPYSTLTTPPTPALMFKVLIIIAAPISGLV